MKSKFLYQDVDLVSLAVIYRQSYIPAVLRCFVCRNYDKVLMETGKLCDNIRVTIMDSCLVFTECLSLRILPSGGALKCLKKRFVSFKNYFEFRMAIFVSCWIIVIIEFIVKFCGQDNIC